MDLARFEFVLETQNSFALPEFKGSTFRGKFGHVLKKTICIMSHRNCEICELRETCAYTYLFETINTKQQQVPRPFVIEPPLTRQQFFLREKPLHLHLTLIGRAIDYLPYFVYCFQRMGEEGIGQDRGRYVVKAVYALDKAAERHLIYEHQNQQLQNTFARISLDDFQARLLPQVTLHFYTPTDIRVNGRPIRELDFPTLLKAILRRYHSLRYFHGDGVKEEFDINWELAGQVELLHMDIENRRFKRFSNRQKQPLRLTGFTGKITYRGPLAPFYPWLKIGELLHVGKNTVFGMGGYRVVG